MALAGLEPATSWGRSMMASCESFPQFAVFARAFGHREAARCPMKRGTDGCSTAFPQGCWGMDRSHRIAPWLLIRATSHGVQRQCRRRCGATDIAAR
jgi:hypothetical protein